MNESYFIITTLSTNVYYNPEVVITTYKTTSTNSKSALQKVMSLASLIDKSPDMRTSPRQQLSYHL
jgi:hypothetical protein